jgi:hypothetical protein
MSSFSSFWSFVIILHIVGLFVSFALYNTCRKSTRNMVKYLQEQENCLAVCPVRNQAQWDALSEDFGFVGPCKLGGGDWFTFAIGDPHKDPDAPLMGVYAPHFTNKVFFALVTFSVIPVLGPLVFLTVALLNGPTMFTVETYTKDPEAA